MNAQEKDIYLTGFNMLFEQYWESDARKKCESTRLDEKNKDAVNKGFINGCMAMLKFEEFKSKMEKSGLMQILQNAVEEAVKEEQTTAKQKEAYKFN